MDEQRKLRLYEAFHVLEISVPYSYGLHFAVNQVHIPLNLSHRPYLCLELLNSQGIIFELIFVIIEVLLHLVIYLLLHDFKTSYSLCNFTRERVQSLLKLKNCLGYLAFKSQEILFDFGFGVLECLFQLL